MLLPDLPNFIEVTRQKYELPPSCLHLEVTESMIMNHRDTVVAAIEKLRAVGIKIDLDDFDTGYSSLSCLHEFPIDVLKIDRAFVSNQIHVCEFSALKHAIVNLADNLGLVVVAEGIETREQLASLQALGCELGQGYFFAPPLNQAELEEYAVRLATPGGAAPRIATACSLVEA